MTRKDCSLRHPFEGNSDTGPVFITFDVSPLGPGDHAETADGPGVLRGFVDARSFHTMPAD